jgi:hypothetical protein
MVAIQVVGGLKWEVRTDTHGQWAEHRVTNVKVIMQVAGPARPDDAIVRVIGRIFRRERADVLPISMLRMIKYTPCLF